MYVYIHSCSCKMGLWTKEEEELENDLYHRYGYYATDYYQFQYTPDRPWFTSLERDGYDFRDRWYSRLVKSDRSWRFECRCCHLLAFHRPSWQRYSKRRGMVLFRCHEPECDCILNFGQYRTIQEWLSLPL